MNLAEIPPEPVRMVLVREIVLPALAAVEGIEQVQLQVAADPGGQFSQEIVVIIPLQGYEFIVPAVLDVPGRRIVRGIHAVIPGIETPDAVQGAPVVLVPVVHENGHEILQDGAVDLNLVVLAQVALQKAFLPQTDEDVIVGRKIIPETTRQRAVPPPASLLGYGIDHAAHRTAV